jgi:predicted dehydrogenase
MGQGTIRWGLLSTARINERLIPAIRETARCELLAAASRGGPEKAGAYASRWSIPRAHGSYEALLADPEVDVVYIGLPNSLHAEWAIKATEAGKHVLCEKPLALTAADVDRMAQAARRCGVILQEAIMMCYHPQTLRLKELIASGAIGAVRLIRGAFTFTLERPGDIRLDPALGGGSLWDLGGYPVSFMRTMVGAEPVEVHGWQDTGAGGADMSFLGQMRFPGGVMTQFFSSFQSVPHADVDLLGSAGKIHLDLPFVNKIGVTARVQISRVQGRRSAGTFGDSAADLVSETLTYENVNGYRNEVEAMAACVLDGASLVVPLTDSRGTIAALEALAASARLGKPAPI